MLRSLLISTLIILSCTQAAAQQWRVAAHIRERIVDTGGTLPLYDFYDSTHYSYHYGTDRSSTPMNDSIEYADRVRYLLDTNGTYYTLEKWERNYNGDNTVASTIYYWSNGFPFHILEADSFTFSNGRMSTRTYYRVISVRDSNNNVVSKLMPQRKWGYTYYTDGQEDVYETVEYLYSQNKTFTPRMKSIIRYSANGNVTADSTYTYTISGWGNGGGAQYLYTLDGTTGNVLEKYKCQYFTSSGNMDTSITNVYVYDAQGRLSIDSSFSGNMYYETHAYGYNAQGQLITDTAYGNGGITYPIFYVYSYTSFGYLDNVVFGRWGIAIPPELVSRERYVYEAYWPVNTQSVAKQADDLIAYPVPSSSFVNIKWHTDKPVQVQGRLVNMQGQIVKQWKDDATGDYYKSIHTANLPAGNYYILLTAGDIELQKAIVIVK